MAQDITSSFNNIHMEAFWKDMNQMGITKADTVTAIGEEGLVQVMDLHEFNKDDLEAVFNALRKPLER